MLEDDSRFDMEKGTILEPDAPLDLFELAATAIESETPVFVHQDRLWKVEVKVPGYKYEIFPEKEQVG